MHCNNTTSSRKPRAIRAFTLVEVIVAVLIFAVVFVGFYANLSQGLGTMELNRENLRATELMMQEMETIRLYRWDQINTAGFVPSGFTASFDPTRPQSSPVYTGSIAITNAPMTENYATNHVFVTVTVSWKSNNKLRYQRQMSTVVSQYGLHNYFY
jgi:prepilin-type N-terminal cleavage/methylation domain-containing protein